MISTLRWKIKFKYSDGNEDETKIYHEDKQAAYDLWNKNFEVISIEQDTDTSYVDFINRIIAKSELINRNSKNQIYKYPHNGSYILVKLYTDGIAYYDYCEYQRWDCKAPFNPITWIVSNPEKFCGLFDKDVPKLPQGYAVTPKEIKKMKVRKFYSKNNEVFWIDDLGYIYSADKIDLPNKHNKAEWEKFHDNENAVLVRYTFATSSNSYGNPETEWFESEEAFLQFCASENPNIPVVHLKSSYEILKIGYQKRKPEDRKSILRLPYINLDAELSYGSLPEDIALAWSKMCSKSWQGQIFDCYNFLCDVVKAYIDYSKRGIM